MIYKPNLVAGHYDKARPFDTVTSKKSHTRKEYVGCDSHDSIERCLHCTKKKCSGNCKPIKH